MSRVLVLGGSGEIGSIAVADLVSQTHHEIMIGDVRVERARRVLDDLHAPSRVIAVDVENPASLRCALRDTDLVLNATSMRHSVPVTDAAIDAGVHLVDLGSHYVDTRLQLERHGKAERAGCCVVPGCGVAPGLTNVLARRGADQLDEVSSIRMYSYVTQPMWTSPGTVIGRLDASSGTSVVYDGGEFVERPSFSDEEQVAFPEPFGRQEVHLAAHPEPVTLSRHIDADHVAFKVAYTASENARIRALLNLAFDRRAPFEIGGTSIAPQRFAASYIGSRGIDAIDRSANVKQVRIEGFRDGEPLSLIYDFAVEETGTPATSKIAGTIAAIATDLVTRSVPAGVLPPEGAFDPRAFLDQLGQRGFEVSESLVAHRSATPTPSVRRQLRSGPDRA